jgi:hydroxyethylthiazole kinase-like uncharacterized protein yjeF
MKPVLTPQQAAELDRGARARGIPGELLMERAGRAVARGAADLCGGVYGRRAVVVCGKGNNGGDGFVAARHLARWGMRVSVVSIDALGDLPESAAANLMRLDEVGVRVRPLSRMEDALATADVAIDAIFGTGFRGTPEDAWAAAITTLNGGDSPIVAVDIPSGVNGGTGAIEGDAVWADLTVTFGAAKIGSVLMPGAERAGAVRVTDIGFPDDLLHADVFVTEPSDVVGVLPARAADSHKRASGVLLVVAGSRGMTGAVKLIAEAAGRVGAGLVTVAVPQSILPVVQTVLTEATFLPLPETAVGTIGKAALGPVLEALERADALAIGPGMSTNDETAGSIRELVRACPVPLIVDADGLNAFSGRASEMAERRGAAVISPHVGEFGRLTGISAADLDADRLTHARTLAATSDAVTLLKGSRTIIASPDGSARINPTGSSFLATAGSGDVLTGMVGGLLARGLDPLDAASSAAYLHGLAGLVGGEDAGEGTSAGDLVQWIPEAVRRVDGG